MLPGLASIPVIHFLLGTVLGVAVALLKFSFELVLLASDDIKIIVGQFSPLLLHLAFDLFPISFHTNSSPCIAPLRWIIRNETLARAFLGLGKVSLPLKPIGAVAPAHCALQLDTCKPWTTIKYVSALSVAY